MSASNSISLRLLGVFAHQDDETFCIGGTLAKYVEHGATAVTQGETGQIRDAAVATRQTLGAKRSPELTQACTELGVQPLSRHRTQYPIQSGMFPQEMLRELLGFEYFIQIISPTTVETTLLPDV